MSLEGFVDDVIRIIPKAPVPGVDDGPDASESLLEGAAGVAFFLYEVGRIRGDAELFERALRWLDEAWRSARSNVPHPSVSHLTRSGASGGAFAGSSGAGYVSVLVGAQAGNPALMRRGTMALAKRWRRLAREPEGVPAGFLSGAAGFASLAADLLERLPELSPKDRARMEAVRREATRRVLVSLARPFRARAGERLGMLHGVAGALAAGLADPRAPVPSSVLQERLAELRALGVTGPDFTLWPTAVGWTGFGRYFSSWCNGSAGMVLLWCRACARFPGKRSSETVRSAVMTTVRARARDASLCCGTAGQALALACAARFSGEAAYRRAALASARRAVAQAGVLPPLGLWRGRLGVALSALLVARTNDAFFPFLESPPRSA